MIIGHACLGDTTGQITGYAKLVLWASVSRPDAAFVAETQLGVTSPRYEPGPLGSTEFMVDYFHRWYVERMRVALEL